MTERGRLGPAKDAPSTQLAKRRSVLDPRPVRAEISRLARQLRRTVRKP